MEVDDGRGSEKPSYWLDACEDISCDDLIQDFVPVEPSNQLGPVDGSVDPCFFGGIDGILEKLKSGDDSVPCVDHNDSNGCSKGSAAAEIIKHNEPQVNKDNTKQNGSDRGKKYLHEGNGLSRHKERDYHDSKEERNGKRARLSGDSREKRGRDRPPLAARKRFRDLENDEINRVDRDQRKRRENHGGRDREWREGRGFWERDKEKNEMVFRVGSWEADRNREGKLSTERSVEPSGAIEKKDVKPKEQAPKEQARKYQLDVLEHARKKNTIAFLETGAGKTLIGILLMKSLCNDLHKQNKKMLAVFLVPKVPLVYQQAEVIREQTGYQVGHYCGEMGQDFWDARRWQREFETKQVLVMTAQILLNILRHSIIKMEAINLLILDECHHAVKKHPYSLVMSEFYHTTQKEKRPSVFGMTASPVNLKGVSSQVDCAIKIRNLETKLDSVVFTIKDRKDLEKHVPMPSEVVVEYDKAASLWSLHEQIKQMESAVEEAAQSSSRRSKWQFMGARDAGAREELRQVYGVSERTESDGAANLIQKLRAINYALGELGQWCAYKVACSFLTALQNDERASYQLDVKFQESYLDKVVSLLQCQLSEGAVAENGKMDESNNPNSDCDRPDEMEEGELLESHVVSSGEHVDVTLGAAVADGKVTPKVQSLIKILLKYQHTEDFRAIIFVERVVTALVLPKVFEELPSLSFITSSSLIGHNNSQEMRTGQMQDTIAKFRDGRVCLSTKLCTQYRCY
uniref:Endoribonuclease Dicer homolog 1 n=1 Tax=Nicotiana tabacum TaxID=4097 RepID=A0A1S3YKR2_TOBAC|nr:PREDICTED: endoribonuclease Dicer homolog 1-like [Nicotiana tabacum]